MQQFLWFTLKIKDKNCAFSSSRYKCNNTNWVNKSEPKIASRQRRSLNQTEQFPKLSDGVVGIGDDVADGPGVGEDLVVVAACGDKRKYLQLATTTSDK